MILVKAIRSPLGDQIGVPYEPWPKLMRVPFTAACGHHVELLAALSGRLS